MTITIATMLLYMIRMILVGAAVGTLYIKLNLFSRMKAGQIMLAGLASTPMIVSLADYILGLVFIGWRSWFYYIVPFTAAALWLAWNSNVKTTLSAVLDIYGYARGIVKSAGKWIYLDIVLSLGVVFTYMCIFCNPGVLVDEVRPVLYSLNGMGRISIALFLLALLMAAACAIRQMRREGVLKTNCYIFLAITVIVYGMFFGMSFNGRPDIDSDRAHYQLDARYFTEDKNSWEVDHYTDEKYGSSLRDDHGPLWIMYLADAQMHADMMGRDDPLRICNLAVFWSVCCFYILLFLTASFLADTYFAGIVSLYLLLLYRYMVLELFGSRDSFRFVGLLLLVLYVLNVISKITEDRANWHHHVFMLAFCHLCMNGHEGNVYIMLGMFMAVAILLILNRAKIKNLILCGSSVLCGTVLGISKTISVYLETGRISSSTILPFHDTPIVQQITEINNKRADWTTIWATYTKPVIFMMCLGLIALAVMLVLSVLKKDKTLFWGGMILSGMLLPMTGIMDWTGYEVSRWFAEQLRYRMYFLMIFAITGSWLLTGAWVRNSVRMACAILVAVVFMLYLKEEYDRTSIYSRPYIASCQDTVNGYRDLADTVASLTDGDVFTNNQVVLYYLHGTPKLLYHIYSEELIQAKSDAEIGKAMDDLNTGAILLPESGLDYHDYSLLPFWEYIHEDGSFSQVLDERSGYVIFYRNQ